MTLLDRWGEGGTDYLCRSRLVTVADGEASVQQTFVHQIGITTGDGLVHPMAVGDGPIAGPGDPAGVIESDHNRNRQIPGNVETLEDLHSHIKVWSAFFNSVEMGEISEVAQMHLFETDTHSDKAFGMTGIGIRSTVQLLHVVDL